ncbi:MAG: glycoside hydrolase family 25 protein [Oscillospiraceae bacterium]|nr:glycoside hydrolase family 25 protein [Oscillospiraceae bacterium]
MEDRQARRQAQKKRQQRRAAGCFSLIVLVVVLLGGYVILRVLGGPGSPNWTSALTANPYTPADFATVNGYVTCTAGPTRLGLDVSEYQEEIDWEQVRAAGFDFVFIRIGYRGYSVGEIFADERARDNLAGAKAAGFDVGVYFYAQAVSPEEALEEARWCLDFLEAEALQLPIVYDWEWVSHDARTGSIDRATLTECVKTFCDTIDSAGYQSMVYFNSHVSRDLMDLEQLAGYPFWLAQYREQLDYPYQVDVWQYTETGSVPGIKGNVDIDLMFLYE